MVPPRQVHREDRLGTGTGWLIVPPNVRPRSCWPWGGARTGWPVSHCSSWGRISPSAGPCDQTREAPQIPPVPPASVPWTQTGLLAVAAGGPGGCGGEKGAGKCPHDRPRGVRLVSQPRLTSSGCRCVYGSVLTPSGVRGGVTFSVSHQPPSYIAARSELPVTARVGTRRLALFSGASAVCASITPVLLLANNPLLLPPKAAVPFAETVIILEPLPAPFPLPGGVEAMRGLAGLDTQEWGRAVAWLPHCPWSVGRPGELADPGRTARPLPPWMGRQPRGLGVRVGRVCYFLHSDDLIRLPQRARPSQRE